MMLLTTEVYMYMLILHINVQNLDVPYESKCLVSRLSPLDYVVFSPLASGA